MIRILSLLAACVLMTSCGPQIKYVFPDPPPPIPELSESIKKACPALAPLKDKSLQTLVQTAMSDAYQYAKCQAGLKAAVELNKITVTEYNSYIESYNKAKKDAKK